MFVTLCTVDPEIEMVTFLRLTNASRKAMLSFSGSPVKLKFKAVDVLELFKMRFPYHVEYVAVKR